jgi:hypothetical protein
MEQDNVRDQARQWVEAANANQATEVRAQTEMSASGGGQATVHDMEGPSVDQIVDISDLAEIQIMMTWNSCCDWYRGSATTFVVHWEE